MGENVWLAWREKDAGKSQIWLMHSSDQGKNWMVPQKVVDTAGGADYPALLQNREQVFLVWNTENEGLKLIPLSSLKAN